MRWASVSGSLCWRRQWERGGTDAEVREEDRRHSRSASGYQAGQTRQARRRGTGCARGAGSGPAPTFRRTTDTGSRAPRGWRGRRWRRAWCLLRRLTGFLRVARLRGRPSCPGVASVVRVLVPVGVRVSRVQGSQERADAGAGAGLTDVGILRPRRLKYTSVRRDDPRRSASRSRARLETSGPRPRTPGTPGSPSPIYLRFTLALAKPKLPHPTPSLLSRLVQGPGHRGGQLVASWRRSFGLRGLGGVTASRAGIWRMRLGEEPRMGEEKTGGRVPGACPAWRGRQRLASTVKARCGPELDSGGATSRGDKPVSVTSPPLHVCEHDAGSAPASKAARYSSYCRCGHGS